MVKPMDPNIWEGIQEIIEKRFPEDIGRVVLTRLQEGAKAQEEVERLEAALMKISTENQALQANQKDQAEILRLQAQNREVETTNRVREEVLKIREDFCRNHIRDYLHLVETVFRGPHVETKYDPKVFQPMGVKIPPEGQA